MRRTVVMIAATKAGEQQMRRSWRGQISRQLMAFKLIKRFLMVVQSLYSNGRKHIYTM